MAVNRYHNYCDGQPYVRPPPPKDTREYHMPSVRQSTFRYARFVKQLRIAEEEHRKAEETRLKNIRDTTVSNFFIHCDRRSMINTVARRVDLCLQSYQEDLKRKRQRLTEILKKEEERDIRMFVEQAQAAKEEIWQEKIARLEYLLEKRKKEHEDKYKDLPISKCVHALPCIVKKMAKETQQCQQYQIMENQARKMAEREYDKMWHEVLMKETEALTARMEYDAMERYRRDQECKEYADKYLEYKRQQRERDRELLKREAETWHQKCKDDLQKEEDERQALLEKSKAVAKERAEDFAAAQATAQKKKEEDEKVQQTWDSLMKQSISEDNAAVELWRRKERELDICNKVLVNLRDQMHSSLNNDDAIKAEAQKQQDSIDRKRCEYLLWSQKTNREVREAMIEQIKDHKDAAEKLKQKLIEEDDYHRDLCRKNNEQFHYRKMVDAQERKKHQAELIEQINYNKLLKERARQEELEQRKKAEAAAKAYQEEINRMVCRPFYQEEIHPFMKQMTSGLKMKPTCPCSKQTYCAEEQSNSKQNPC